VAGYGVDVSGTHQGPGQVSARLVQVLRTYCYGMNLDGIADLRDSLDAGRYPWLQWEFGAALASDAFNPWLWADCVGEPTPAPVLSETTTMYRCQEALWTQLFPGVRFPGRSADLALWLPALAVE
jgi:hypothetical protein